MTEEMTSTNTTDSGYSSKIETIDNACMIPK